LPILPDMSEPVIQAENISKKYRISLEEEKADTLAGQLRNILSYPFRNWQQISRLKNLNEHEASIFWALQDINFSINEGDVMGIIGHNGAGKSTLLKILSRITEPSSGRIRMRGKVSSLLEVGTGFHPELSGRDNVFMNGTLLGMSRKEVQRKFDEIVAFAGTEKYIDTPVKFYSSGMKVRLAFAVAAHLDPEILIIDEVLAVGDLSFQRKCLGKMDEVSQGGRTVLFVSHNMDSVKRLCNRGMVLENGRITYSGNINDAVNSYMQQQISASLHKTLHERSDRSGSGLLRFQNIWLANGKGEPVDFASCGDDLKVFIKIQGDTSVVSSVYLGISLRDEYGNLLTKLAGWTKGETVPVAGDTRVSFNIPKFPLPEGSYLIDLFMADGSGGNNVLDQINSALKFEVKGKDFYKSGKVHQRVDYPFFINYSLSHSNSVQPNCEKPQR